MDNIASICVAGRAGLNWVGLVVIADLIAARGLGLVKGLVGQTDQVFGRCLVVGDATGQAKTYGGLKIDLPASGAVCGNILPQDSARSRVSRSRNCAFSIGVIACNRSSLWRCIAYQYHPVFAGSDA